MKNLYQVSMALPFFGRNKWFVETSMLVDTSACNGQMVNQTCLNVYCSRLILRMAFAISMGKARFLGRRFGPSLVSLASEGC